MLSNVVHNFFLFKFLKNAVYTPIKKVNRANKLQFSGKQLQISDEDNES